jgi:hypothetical protein
MLPSLLARDIEQGLKQFLITGFEPSDEFLHGLMRRFVQDQADGASVKRADDAEERLVEEVRRMGQEAMQAWALRQIEQTEQEVRRTGRAHREGKKN